MAEQRRTLTDGLAPVAGIDPRKEANFVFGPKPQPQPHVQEPPPRLAVAPGPKASAEAQETRQERVQKPVEKPRPGLVPQTLLLPVTTRLRAPLVAGLRRASLERQLDGLEPCTQQEIIEEALEPWLRKNGYLG